MFSYFNLYFYKAYSIFVLLADSHTVCGTKDEAGQAAMLRQLRELYDASRAICDSAGQPMVRCLVFILELFYNLRYGNRNFISRWQFFVF